MTDSPEFAHLKLAEMLEILACPQSQSYMFRERLAMAIGARERASPSQCRPDRQSGHGPARRTWTRLRGTAALLGGLLRLGKKLGQWFNRLK